MRALVTGGSGFIGSHVVDRLRARGVEPRIYDMRTSRYHPDADTVLGDLDDIEALTGALDGCDAVLHLAAVADVADVVADPARAERVNARGTLNVLEAARLSGGPHVLYASTIWVYNGLTGEVDEDTPPGPPSHLYTATKLAGELYCRAYRDSFDVRSTILRFGIPYGPRAREAAVIPSFVNRALAGEPISIAGDGRQTRRFVYVEDLAEGMVRGLDDSDGRIYNLVGDESVSVLEIASTIRDIVADVEIVHTEARGADFTGAEVSGARALREIGWAPQTPFRDGVRRYVDWRRAA